MELNDSCPLGWVLSVQEDKIRLKWKSITPKAQPALLSKEDLPIFESGPYLMQVANLIMKNT